MKDRAKAVIRWASQAARTCRYLWTCRAAIPWPVKALLAMAMVIKCLPLDFGVDEALTAIAVLLLQRFRPGLIRACWQAASLRA